MNQKHKEGDTVFFLCWGHPAKYRDKKSLCYRLPKVVSAEIESINNEQWVRLVGFGITRKIGVLFKTKEELLSSIEDSE